MFFCYLRNCTPSQSNGGAYSLSWWLVSLNCRLDINVYAATSLDAGALLDEGGHGSEGSLNEKHSVRN